VKESSDGEPLVAVGIWFQQQFVALVTICRLALRQNPGDILLSVWMRLYRAAKFFTLP